ncbi:uncharacterized protein LOC100823030 [Brachypodium distachyon]|nr:uncharacterized protein LOC100823030 [Brachypodium distachyon]|eukprot:XP_010230262.2 uncharacterized protein LOC100823030 [Brachypodium distachyon]
MFSRDNNRLDYQLFFRTRGAFRSIGWNGLVLIICVSNCLVWLLTSSQSDWVPQLIGLLLVSPCICVEVARLLLCDLLQHGISLWSPIFAILVSMFMAPTLIYNLDDDSWILRRNIVLTTHMILLVVVLLVTLSRLQFPGIVKLVDSTLGDKLLPWRRVIIRLCMLAAMVTLVFTSGTGFQYGIIIFQVLALVVVSFGNLQIPAAGLRIGLALSRIRDNNYLGDDDQMVPEKINLVPSLNIFYAMVLAQGILYIAACILEVFSFIPRRSLVRRAEFRGRMGVEHVNLYYAYAFEKCMRGAMLTPEKIGLIRFAMDSMKSDSPKMQLHGVQILHNLLKNEPFKTKAISRLTNSMKTMTSLFNMLGRTSEGDKDIRSYATKVMAEIADSLRIVSIPGAMQLIASLLDIGHRQKIIDPLLDIDIPEAEKDTSSQPVGKEKHKFMMLTWWKQLAIYCLIPTEDRHSSNRDEPNSYMHRCWKWIAKCWSIPKENPSTNQDLLPVLAMSILDKLASFDLENCMEISRATGLISKIIDYTRSRTEMKNIDEAQQIMLKGSSLKLLRTLVGTKGKFGVTLRQKISEHPFLLSNLAQILDDSCSSREHKELTAEILRNLAMDGNTRAEIGHIRNIISRLMHAFISKGGPSSTNSDHLLGKIAGQALALLAMENTNNCLVMLAGPDYVFIKELTIMIHSERYKYIAASLLRYMCVHARPQLTSSDLKDLSQILPKVWEGIMDTEGAELEILVGLSSQICNVLPDYFSQELEHYQIKETFIQRLVDVLNATAIPTSQCPGIRRVVVEHAISMMEGNHSYTSCFEQCEMMETLLMVERTPSRAENYRFLLDDAGVMEHNVPLPALVARAKELMGRGWL